MCSWWCISCVDEPCHWGARGARRRPTFTLHGFCIDGIHDDTSIAYEGEVVKIHKDRSLHVHLLPTEGKSNWFCRLGGRLLATLPLKERRKENENTGQRTLKKRKRVRRTFIRRIELPPLFSHHTPSPRRRYRSRRLAVLCDCVCQVVVRPPSARLSSSCPAPSDPPTTSVEETTRPLK